jgi:membrane protein required for colicin V production
VTTFDWVVIAVVALSTLAAFFRGVVRELIALVAWVLGFVGAIAFTPALGAMLPDLPEYPAVRYILAFALIIIGALLAGALIAWPLSTAVRAAGLGFVDRFLGSIFGLARGAALVLAFVIVAGLTPLPRAHWWQSAVLVPPLVAGVTALAPHLPAALVRRLDYSRGGTAPKTAPVEAT